MIIQNTHFGNTLELRCGHVDGVHNSGDHLHQYFEIELVVDGEIEITVDGQKHIARAGDIAVITPFRVHSFYTPSHVKMLICTFPTPFITDFLPFTEICRKRQNAVFSSSEHLWAYLINSGFYQNVRTKRVFDPVNDYNYIHKLKSVFYLILSEYFERSPVTGSAGVDNTLSKILIYIYESYDKDISLESVGAALGYSPKYVSGCFKVLAGFGFRSFVNSLRVEKAKTLLGSTDKNNSEIACECGFVSQASFHRVFREQVGLSPQKYKLSVKLKQATE